MTSVSYILVNSSIGGTLIITRLVTLHAFLQFFHFSDCHISVTNERDSWCSTIADLQLISKAKNSAAFSISVVCALVAPPFLENYRTVENFTSSALYLLCGMAERLHFKILLQ